MFFDGGLGREEVVVGGWSWVCGQAECGSLRIGTFSVHII